MRSYEFFENMWQSLLALGVVAVASVILIFIFAPKNVDYYYMSGTSEHGTAACVNAHWTWAADQTVFCTDDSNKAIDFMNRANLALKAGK